MQPRGKEAMREKARRTGKEPGCVHTWPDRCGDLPSLTRGSGLGERFCFLPAPLPSGTDAGGNFRLPHFINKETGKLTGGDATSPRPHGQQVSAQM